MPTTYAIPNGRTVMDATTYTGTGSTQSIVNAAGFKPDLIWGKNRSAGSTSNWLENSVTGAGQVLYSDQTSSEQNNSTYLPSINSNGFTVAGNTSYFNASGNNFVAWQWQAGQGSTSSNTSGSITSTVSVNATAGFSVATFTAQASGTGTVGHGLGVAPAFIITKNRNGTIGWNVYHQSLSGTQYIVLNSTAAASTSSVIWNNTNPTSTVFSFGSGFAGSGTYVAYCWAQVAGFSQFGSYTGNGSADGPFIYTGFRPRYIFVKRTDSTGGSWHTIDTSRSPYNQVGVALYLDLSAAESSDFNSDILSNGLKIRNSQGEINASGGTYIYAAFAENPFKYANAR